VLVLGIETSCDETAAAVVRDGRDVLSNTIWSQVQLHSPYGGVVPELASRAHVRNITTVVEMALSRAGVTLGSIDLIAVTRGPGLVGSLLVGLEFAKAVAFARRIPLVAVHHIAAHLYSPFLRQSDAAHSFRMVDPDFARAHTVGHKQNTAGKVLHSAFSIQHSAFVLSAPLPRYPYLGLAISGGHSSLTLVEGPDKYRTVGETRDDAVGEAYDKVAKIVGLGYPGGPIIDSLAGDGNPDAIRFPRPLRGAKTLDFSFSGLKTAVLHYVEGEGLESIRNERSRLCDVAASFQAAVIETLLEKTLLALQREAIGRLAVVGGVASNQGLRRALKKMWRGRRGRLWIPPPTLCTDNAAMVAGLGYRLARAGHFHNDLALNADPGWELDKACESER